MSVMVTEEGVAKKRIPHFGSDSHYTGTRCTVKPQIKGMFLSGQELLFECVCEIPDTGRVGSSSNRDGKKNRALEEILHAARGV